MWKLFSFRSIYTKVVVVFVAILWLSSSFAFMLGFAFFKDNLVEEIQQGLIAKANHIVDFNKKYHVNPQDLPSLLNDDSVKMTLYQDISQLKMLTDMEKQAVTGGEVVKSISDKKHRLPIVVFEVQDSFILLSASPNKDFMVFIRDILGIVSLICAVMGSVLIAIAARMIVKPIKLLTKATKEVAKGNFDIKLKTSSSDEVGQLAADFNLMTEELKNIEYLRKDFISSVSHEFKTPMTSIQGFAKLLKDDSLSKEQLEEYSDIIIAETGRLANLSNNLLRLSRLENQVIQEQYRHFSLDEQIRKVILLLEHKWSEKNMELDLDLDKLNCYGDEELLRQVWINLIENAIKFSYPDGSLQISAKAAMGKLQIIISDQGIGIAEQDTPRIFEKFYMGDKSRSKEGSGLGLALVKKIIELHQGSISFKSQLGEGTTFFVELKQ